MSNSVKRQKFVDLLTTFGSPEIKLSEIKDLCAANDLAIPYWYINDEANKISRGVYKTGSNTVTVKTVASNDDLQIAALSASVAKIIPLTEKSGNRISNITTDLEATDLVPKVYKNYVPFGNFDDVLNIIQSNQFFPVFVTGQSGNGKTMSIEQACAKLKRKFICVSMTPESDESDLLGNFVLINGQMEWRDGPVTVAAREGAVLCIDEIDYGAQNLSCLQRVLEGKPFLLKKKNELVTPAEGFTIFATANTKGKGSDDGRFMFTNVLNEAFLERFVNTFEQDWPPVAVEKKIVRGELKAVGAEDNEFADKLVTWADVIRQTFKDGGCDEVIATRRLVHIARTFGIYKDRAKAISYCLNRFDEDTKASFLDLYTKLDASVESANTVASTSTVQNDTVGKEIPF
jgi:MoxR-like ATPase